MISSFDVIKLIMMINPKETEYYETQCITIDYPAIILVGVLEAHQQPLLNELTVELLSLALKGS